MESAFLIAIHRVNGSMAVEWSYNDEYSTSDVVVLYDPIDYFQLCNVVPAEDSTLHANDSVSRVVKLDETFFYL